MTARVHVLPAALIAALVGCGAQATSAAPTVTTVALPGPASADASAPVSSVPPLPPRASASLSTGDPPVPHLDHCVLHAGSREYRVSRAPTAASGSGQVAPGPGRFTDTCSLNAECGIPGQQNEGDGDASIRCINDDCECLVERRPERGSPVRFSFTEPRACAVEHGVGTLLIDRCMRGMTVSNDPRDRKRVP